MAGLDLNREQLLEIALEMEKRVIQGLEEDDEQEIRCLLTYVPLPRGPSVTGQALALDLGGTHARAAHVSFDQGEAIVLRKAGPEKIPWVRKVPFELERLLDIQADLLASLDAPADLPLGYCFSYATQSTYDGDGVLVELGKEIIVEPDILGKRVGKLLLEHLRTRDDWVMNAGSVRVINDAVAGLFAGLIESSPGEQIISLVVGTGHNIAALMEPGIVFKLAKKNPDWKSAIAVNLESGNFTPPHLTELDDLVDSKSGERLRGRHRFEKAVSGVYLGQLLKAAFPESDFDAGSGSEGLVKLAYESPNAHREQIRTAREILSRSADLVAASLAGLIKLLNASRVLIVAEGGLFWGAPGYEDRTRSTLSALLARLGHEHTEVEFRAIEHANLIGSAVAALGG